MLVDTVATCFVLPFLTTLVITTVIWGEMRNGHLTEIPRAAGSFADRLPKTRLRRATMVGLICLVLFGPLSAAGVLLFDYGDISIGEFVLFKAIFGIVLGADGDAPDRDGRVRRRPAAGRRRAGRPAGLEQHLPSAPSPRSQERRPARPDEQRVRVLAGDPALADAPDHGDQQCAHRGCAPPAGTSGENSPSACPRWISP